MISNLYFVESKEKPEEYKIGVVWVIGDETKEVISFLCPCKCGDIINLNLLPGASERWKYRGNKTITPSIKRKTGCMSNFTITGGMIKFHNDVENR
tara:strand:+ start:5491 stop:5778 length:288 start_codon:yes stop_codon:yes gene_type:complete